MGIMPHKDAEQALRLALSLDIPFWPQLPHVNYHEDMYVQASEHFPGIIVDISKQRIAFDSARFEHELIDYSQRMADPLTFALSDDYSVVYRRFLSADLNRYPAIRGQIIGPVSFGFRVFDENNVPIIYNEAARTLLFDFMSRKVNAQYLELKEHNPNAFIWLDEPGLSWVFSGFSGYNDVLAKKDYGDFLGSLVGPGAMHLCANVNLPYLLSMGVTLLSFDAYQLEEMPKGYAAAIAQFLKGGGIISWGIVPTDGISQAKETAESLVKQLLNYWIVIASNSDVTTKQIAESALIAPARCCLKNIGQVGGVNESIHSQVNGCVLEPEEKLVEAAFTYLKQVSRMLREEFNLAES